MSGIMKGLGKVLPIVLGAAAVIFTAGAAIPAIGAIVGTGGLSGAVGGLLSSVGIDATSTLGGVIAGAVTDAGYGAAIGAAGAAVTGGDPLKGAASGMEMGAITGGVMGGIGALSGPAAATVQAPNIAGDVGTQTVSSATPSIASSGVADSGVAGAGLTGATPGAVTPVTTATLPGVAGAGTAANGSGGLLAQGPGVTAATASPASTGAAGTISNPAAGPALASNPAAGPTPPAPTPPASGGGLMSFLGNGGPLGNGGLGYAISGLGQGLMEGQAAQDTAKAAQTLAQQGRDATTTNYGTDPATQTYSGGGGLLSPAAPQSNLRTPAQAFNPTSRWVYDPNQKKLVLVPSTTS